uniref:Uncharacterized protein n=1 Tax=Knipowitschia caucasica TaxID=637954 RepID=A0AAV2K359_KNICA
MCSARNSKDTAQNPQAPWPLVEDPSLERDNRPRRAKVRQEAEEGLFQFFLVVSIEWLSPSCSSERRRKSVL